MNYPDTIEATESRPYPVISSQMARKITEKNYSELQKIQQQLTNKNYANNTNSG